MLIIQLFPLLYSTIRSLKKIRKQLLKLKKNYKENLTKRITFKIMRTDLIILFINQTKINNNSIIKINKMY